MLARHCHPPCVTNTLLGRGAAACCQLVHACDRAAGQRGCIPTGLAVVQEAMPQHTREQGARSCPVSSATRPLYVQQRKKMLGGHTPRGGGETDRHTHTPGQPKHSRSGKARNAAVPRVLSCTLACRKQKPHRQLCCCHSPQAPQGPRHSTRRPALLTKQRLTQGRVCCRQATPPLPSSTLAPPLRHACCPSAPHCSCPQESVVGASA
jgi:hypothetical protein